jgi:hypothetical protein
MTWVKILSYIPVITYTNSGNLSRGKPARNLQKTPKTSKRHVLSFQSEENFLDEF